MTRLRVLLSRTLDVVLGRRRDARLDEEIQTHLDLLTEEYVRRGLSRAEAARAARREFGGVARTREVVREQRGLPLIDTVVQDARFAVRLLNRDRTFAVTAMLVLAVGIGVNNMLFAILNAHTLRGMPIPRADRVAVISTVNDRNQDRSLSFDEFEQLRLTARSFSTLVALAPAPVIVSTGGRAPERLDGVFIAGDAVALTGTGPASGRGLAPGDDRPGAAPVALITAGGASRVGAEAAPGGAVLVNGAPATIVGVASTRSGLPVTADVWLPLSLFPGLQSGNASDRILRVFARLRDDATFDAAAAEVQSAADRSLREHPASEKKLRAVVVPINERYFGRWTDPSWLAFMCAGGLVVLISAANVANLMLGRTARRTRELAIRTTLGASRRRLVRQLLMEGAVLAALGSGLGLGVATAGIRVFRSAIPQEALPYWIDYSPDGRVVAALILVAVGTLFVFALLPALHASKPFVGDLLKDGGRGSATGRTQRWTTAFLAAEFALGMVLMSQLVVSARAGRPPLPSDEAIVSPQVLMATVTLAGERYRTPEQRLDFHRALEDRVRGLSDVAALSIANVPPGGGGAEVSLELPGGAASDPAAAQTALMVTIGPRYFETLALPMVRGREFADLNRTGQDAEIVINQELARRLFGTADAIGQRVGVRAPAAPDSPAWSTVVGVAVDVRQRRSPDPEPIVYRAYGDSPLSTATLLVRGSVDGAGLTASLKNEVAALDPNLPLYRVATLADAAWNARWNGRMSHRLILTMTLIAAVLSAVGLYAVTSYAVSQRAHEIGIRVALGAGPRQIAGLIVRRGLVQLGFGMLAGVGCIRLWASLLPSGSADVSVTDPGALAIVASVFTAMALAACAVPARRAARLDPVDTIRQE